MGNGARTKDRILDTAERLFGDRGFPATSLRDITTEADVNLASVNYHFGSKEALLAAVLKRRFGPINERRLELLDQAEARGAPELEDVVRAFLSPPFDKQQEWGARGPAFLRVLGRIHHETNEEFRATFMQQFDLVSQRFTAALRRTLPHLDTADIRWRMLFMVGSMAFTMSWGESLASREPSVVRDPKDVLESLVVYAAAGLAAPVPQPVAGDRTTRRD